MTVHETGYDCTYQVLAFVRDEDTGRVLSRCSEVFRETAVSKDFKFSKFNNDRDANRGLIAFPFNKNLKPGLYLCKTVAYCNNHIIVDTVDAIPLKTNDIPVDAFRYIVGWYSGEPTIVEYSDFSIIKSKNNDYWCGYIVFKDNVAGDCILVKADEAPVKKSEVLRCYDLLDDRLNKLNLDDRHFCALKSFIGSKYFNLITVSGFINDSSFESLNEDQVDYVNDLIEDDLAILYKNSIGTNTVGLACRDKLYFMFTAEDDELIYLADILASIEEDMSKKAAERAKEQSRLKNLRSLGYNVL